MLVEIEVKRPVSIPGGDKSRVIDLRPGITQVDDSIFGHWFVKSLVKSGVIALVRKKVHVFKSLDQIAEEKKAAAVKKSDPVVETKAVVFASHVVTAPVGTVLEPSEAPEISTDTVAPSPESSVSSASVEPLVETPSFKLLRRKRTK